MMAVPTSFNGENAVLGKPPEVDDKHCDPLNIYRGATPCGMRVMVSCWKLEKAELDELLRTGRIWLWVYGGTHPMVHVGAVNPFGGEETLGPGAVAPTVIDDLERVAGMHEHDCDGCGVGCLACFIKHTAERAIIDIKRSNGNA